MPRKPRNQLYVNQEEHDWITKTISRKAAQINKMEGKKDKEMTYLLALNVKLEPLPEFSFTEHKFVVPTTRVEARIIQKLAKSERAALLTQIIPGYLERVVNAKDEKERARLTQYRVKAEERANMLAELNNTIVRRLND